MLGLLFPWNACISCPKCILWLEFKLIDSYQTSGSNLLTSSKKVCFFIFFAFITKTSARHEIPHSQFIYMLWTWSLILTKSVIFSVILWTLKIAKSCCGLARDFRFQYVLSVPIKRPFSSSKCQISLYGPCYEQKGRFLLTDLQPKVYFKILLFRVYLYCTR